jgi:hypothetical protein
MRGRNEWERIMLFIVSFVDACYILTFLAGCDGDGVTVREKISYRYTFV